MTHYRRKIKMLTQEQIDKLKADGMTIMEEPVVPKELRNFEEGHYLILLGTTKPHKKEKPFDWQVADVRPNLTVVGHVFAFDLSDVVLAYKRLDSL